MSDDIKMIFDGEYGILRTHYWNGDNMFEPTRMARIPKGSLLPTHISQQRLRMQYDERHGAGASKRRRIRIKKRIEARARALRVEHEGIEHMHNPPAPSTEYTRWTPPEFDGPSAA